MATGYSSLTFCIGKMPDAERETVLQNLPSMQAPLFMETGVVIPVINLREDRSLEPGMCRLLIDDRAVITFPMLQDDEFWVSALFADVAAPRFGRTWEGREHVLPGLLPIGSVLKGDSDAQELWQKEGFATARGARYVDAALYTALKAFIPELLVPPLVDYYLNVVALKFPVLVRTARAHFAVDDLTRELRIRLQASTSIRNFAGVLEQLIANQLASAEASPSPTP